MARNPKTEDRKKEEEHVQVLSNAEVEPVPEVSGSTTSAVAKAAPREPEHKGPAKALVNPPPAQVKPVRWFRVLADRNIMGATGFRAKLRAGKELNDVQYNPKALRAQGVQLEEIKAEEVMGL